jgi:uncharacterized protein
MLARGVVALAVLALSGAGCGEDEGARDPSRDLALVVAAGTGQLEEVKRLLQEGASVDAKDAVGNTALLAAALTNRVAVAEVLMEAGSDVNEPDRRQQSAYLVATSEVGDEPRLLELTLEHGADVDAKDSYDGTGLIRAAERGYVRIVRRLLETDVDVDHVNRLGWTALLEAVILGDGGAGHTDVVRLLVEEGGADVEIGDGEGRTALDHARERGYAAIAAILEPVER